MRDVIAANVEPVEPDSIELDVTDSIAVHRFRLTRVDAERLADELGRAARSALPPMTEAVGVDCPVCLAVAGDPCWTLLGGTRKDNPHPSRWRRAKVGGRA